MAIAILDTPPTPTGLRRHRVALYALTAASEADGGFAVSQAALAPAAVWARIVPATAAQLERVASGAVISTATHIVTMPYHAGVTTKTRIVFGSRVFSVMGVATPDERQIETVALCVEVVA